MTSCNGHVATPEGRRMLSRALRWLPAAWNSCRPVAGTILILLGLALTCVPILPGTPLLFLGIAVAGASHPIVRFLRRHWERFRKTRQKHTASGG